VPYLATSGDIHPSTRHRIRQDFNLQLHRCENLKSRKLNVTYLYSYAGSVAKEKQCCYRLLRQLAPAITRHTHTHTQGTSSLHGRTRTANVLSLHAIEMLTMPSSGTCPDDVAILNNAKYR